MIWYGLTKLPTIKGVVDGPKVVTFGASPPPSITTSTRTVTLRSLDDDITVPHGRNNGRHERHHCRYKHKRQTYPCSPRTRGSSRRSPNSVPLTLYHRGSPTPDPPSRLSAPDGVLSERVERETKMRSSSCVVERR